MGQEIQNFQYALGTSMSLDHTWGLSAKSSGLQASDSHPLTGSSYLV